jgi:hypothetical protein
MGRSAQSAPLRGYPFRAHTVIDVHRGIGLNELRAAELPLRGALGFFLHSNAVRFDDGVLDGLDVMLYALAPKTGDPMQYTVGGGMTLRDGRVAVSALASPIRDLHGHIGIVDDTLTLDSLAGSVAGLPLHGHGAFYGITGRAQAWFGIAGDGNLASMRALFPFARNVPLSGPVHVETLFASALDAPMIRNAFVIPHLRYDRYPFENITGNAEVFGDSVVVDGVTAHFGKITAELGGRVIAGPRRGDDIVFALDASGPGAALPYADMLAPDSQLHATALLTEVPNITGWLARGTVSTSGTTDGGVTFSVDNKGVGAFGPLAFTRPDGSWLSGGFQLERPISQSAGWIDAHHFRLGAVRANPLPGVVLPTFPPISGVIDGSMAAGGTPSAFGVAGRMHGQDLRYQNFALGTGTVTLGGTFADLRLSSIALDGPLGRFDGSGALANDVFGLTGRYDGALSALQPFIGSGIPLSGGIHGDLRAAISGDRIVVQSPGAAFTNARVRGIPLDRIAGTMLVQGKSLRVLAADATVGGGRAVIADAGGPFVVSAPAIPARALAGAGLPLQGGELALFGLADLRGGAPRFDGTIALDDGVADGYPVSGGADLAFDGRAATVRDGIAAFGATYGAFDGRIGVAGGAPSYDLSARVPLGDIGDIRRAMRLPLPTLEGSFSANVHVRGSGAEPRVVGSVLAPEGAYNGLAFHDLEGTIDASPDAIVARDASVTVGSTHAEIAASVAGRAFNVDVRSGHVDLQDFDDYFNEAETLAGTGSVALDFANDGRATRTSGRVALTGVRFRRFAFGTTDASWSQRGGAVTAALDISGEHGSMRANGTVIAASGGPIRAVTAANVNVRAAASNVDLGTWLPPFGITAPVFGRVDATALVRGVWPRLAATIGATLHNGSIYGFPVAQGTLHAQSDGGRLALSNTVLDLGFARFDASGTFGLGPSDPLALSVHGAAPDVGKAIAAALPRRASDVAGALQADARIAGTLRKPRATVGFALTHGRYRSLPISRILGSIAYDGTTLEVRDAEATLTHGTAFLAGSLPLSLRPLGIRPHAPFSFTLALGQLALAPFAPFLPGGQTTLGGTVDGTVAIEGTTEAPRVVGSLALANGSYVSELETAPITGANARLTFAGTSVALEALHANVGGGTIDGSGRLDLPFPNAPSRGYAIAIAAHAARFALPQYASGQIDGNLTLSRRGRLPLLAGDVTLTHTSVPFSSILRDISGGGGGANAMGPPFDLAFNVIAHVGKSVRVQGPIIDVGATGTIALTGTIRDPKLDGTLTATPGGVFSTYNRAFRIQQATVTFQPENGLTPFIDARAFAHVTNPDPDPSRNPLGSADITITVRGPADVIASGTPSGGGDYGISYTSNPPYDQEQILGLLLDASVFGAINFGRQQTGFGLAGAPSPTNALLPPGVTPYQTGALNFQQEAFSILNGQLVQRFLAPVESVLTGPLGLSDLELTVDFGGRVGYIAYKQVGHRDVYANIGQVLTAPSRTTFGFTARPDAITSILFNYYRQNGVPAITNNASGIYPFSNNVTQVKGISPLVSPAGFTFQIVRKYP